MQTIQVVIDEGLLRQADEAARRRRVNRSVLIRQAVRAYLRQIRVQEQEARDRDGYARCADGEFAVWEAEAQWPDE